jgi:hypothetical protein
MLCAADSSGLTSSRSSQRRSRSRKVAIRHAQVQSCFILKSLANSGGRAVSRNSILSLRPCPIIITLDELVQQTCEFQCNAKAETFVGRECFSDASISHDTFAADHGVDLVEDSETMTPMATVAMTTTTLTSTMKIPTCI